MVASVEEEVLRDSGNMLLLVVGVSLNFSEALDRSSTVSTNLELGFTFPSLLVWDAFALNLQLGLHAVLVEISWLKFPLTSVVLVCGSKLNLMLRVKSSLQLSLELNLMLSIFLDKISSLGKALKSY